jgi:hypothetical protein
MIYQMLGGLIVTKLISLLRSLEESDQILVFIAFLSAAGIALLGILRFFFELRAFIEDLVNKFIRREDFKIKRTILKAIAKDNQTQIVKLRTLRFFRKRPSLEIDQSPEIVDDLLDQARYPEMLNQFAIPGVVKETHTHRLRVDFREDEIPKVPSDYTYITSKVLNATMDRLWGEPGIVAEKPVGSESLAVEFFCPPKWHYRRTLTGKPEIKVYTLRVEGSQKEEDKVYLPKDRITCEGARYEFNKQEGPIDWLRVIVRKPPYDSDINVDWFWDEATEKHYQDRKAAKQATGSSAGV